MKIKSFGNRFIALASKRSPFCLGIDPTKDLLKDWDLKDNISGLKKMCAIITKAAGDRLALVKPQAAYFERFGPEGLMVLKNLVTDFHKQGTLVMFDGKRGDIGSTSLAYAESYLGVNSFYKFDAMTATAYLGFDAIKPMLDHAAKTGCAIFIVTLSSNKEGELIQNAITSDNINAADHIASKIAAYNLAHSNDAFGPAAAVMGATLKNVKSTITKLGGALMLAPGLGFQGATMNDLLKTYHGVTNHVIPTSSRAVLSKGPDVKHLRNEIEKNCEEAFLLIQ